jgi:transcriptional regulator GlxA family with amidase domain
MAVQKVAIAIHDGVQALDVAGPVDVFTEANAYIPAEDRYETVLVAPHRAPLRASNNMQMVTDLGFEEASDGFDLRLLAGYAAGMLLEGSDRALKAIAYDCGFGTADRMRIVFQ